MKSKYGLRPMLVLVLAVFTVVMALFTYTWVRQEPPPPATQQLLVPKESARDRILSNYRGRARELKEKALETGRNEDVLAFANWVSQHPEDVVK